MTAAVDNMPETDYHRHPALSSTGARKLLPPSCPAIFKWERDTPPAPKPHFDFGHAAHTLALGRGVPVEVIDADDWRTKPAQDARKAAHTAGKAPILAAEWGQVQAMAAVLRLHPLAAVLFNPDNGTAEQSFFWTDPETGVDCRARFDWLTNPGGGRLIIPDYKTAVTANPQVFARKHAPEYGYPQQGAWYRDAAIAAGLDDDPAFLFVVQEKTAPYLVSVIELDREALATGAALNYRARTVYAECSEADRWPGYSDDVALVSLPNWYHARIEEL